MSFFMALFYVLSRTKAFQPREGEAAWRLQLLRYVFFTGITITGANAQAPTQLTGENVNLPSGEVPPGTRSNSFWIAWAICPAPFKKQTVPMHN